MLGENARDEVISEKKGSKGLLCRDLPAICCRVSKLHVKSLGGLLLNIYLHSPYIWSKRS